MVHDYEEMWGSLKMHALGLGDGYQLRLNGSSSWEDFKHSQGMLEALRMMVMKMQALELGIEEEDDHAGVE